MDPERCPGPHDYDNPLTRKKVKGLKVGSHQEAVVTCAINRFSMAHQWRTNGAKLFAPLLPAPLGKTMALLRCAIGFPVMERQWRIAAQKEEMMSDRPIDDLTRALSAWLTSVAHQLDTDRLEILYACLNADQHDVYVVARLREGAVVLEGVNNANGTLTEFWREDVERFRLDRGFGMRDTSTKQ